jgi:hypothetical protein
MRLTLRTLRQTGRTADRQNGRFRAYGVADPAPNLRRRCRTGTTTSETGGGGVNTDNISCVKWLTLLKTALPLVPTFRAFWRASVGSVRSTVSGRWRGKLGTTTILRRGSSSR